MVSTPAPVCNFGWPSVDFDLPGVPHRQLWEGRYKASLTQGQPLGKDRFSEKICEATGIRRTQQGRGSPAGKPGQSGDTETQNDFGF